jgi:hypothetical protein
MDTEGFNYLGTIDDVAVRFPWRFKLTESALNHALLTQLIDGRPVLLNDGYLVQHKLAREAVMDQQSLLWELMRVGFVRVMARGGDLYTLDEMPAQMSKIRSFFDLIHDQVAGVKWLDLRKALAEVDGRLRAQNHLVNWPAFESGSGFRLFAQRMLDQQSQPRSLGLGRHIRSAILAEFLKRFVEKVSEDPVGPRDTWEHLAKRMSREDGKTSDANAFVNGLMNLATETYHYNMGIMLTAQYGVPVSVETQTSPAFDDLLIRPDIVADEIITVPRLRAPRVLTTVDPRRLASIVAERDSAVFRARSAWMARRNAWEQRHAQGRTVDAARKQAELADLKEAGKAYASALTALVGKHLKYEHTEGMFNTIIGAVASEGSNKLAKATGLAAAAAAATVGLPPLGVAVAGVAAGYVVSHSQKKLLGGVVRKFRVKVFEHQVIPPEWIERSRRVVAQIIARRSPSSIDIDSSVAAAFATQLKPYVPR